MNEISISFILAIISVLIIKEYIETILICKNLRFFWVFWLVNVLIADLLEFNSGIPIVNVLFNFLFVFYICAVGYKGFINQKIIASFSLIVIWGIVELIVGNISNLIYSQVEVSGVQWSILSKVFTLFFVEIIKYVRARYWPKASTIAIIPKYWWLMIILPGCSIIIVYYIFFLTSQIKDTKMVWGGLLSSCLFLLLNLGILKIYDLLINEYELRQKNIVYTQYINLYGNEMKEKEIALVDKHIIHDYKKHLAVIQHIAKKNEYKEIQHYCDGLYYDNIKDNILANCGNVAIDAMINSKYSVAVKENIKYTAQLTIPLDMGFENADLCVVLGNMLDNAYEAVQKADEKIINIAIVYDSGKLTIGVKNTFNGMFNQDSLKNYITSKEDKDNHGFGLQIVKKVVKKYNGFMNIDYDDTFFTVIVILRERNLN